MTDFKIKFPNNFFASLKKSSEDSTNHEYMVENEFEVLKLDDYISKSYQKEVHASMCLKGGDACFEKNDKIYIIEFKNCYLTNQLGYEVLEKMYASSIVVMDKLDISVSEFRSKANFITVYNYNKDSSDESEYAQHAGMAKIRNHVAKKGSKKIEELDKVAFGLTKLEKNIYHKVSAISVENFQQYLKNENII